MKKNFIVFLILALAIDLFAQTPTKKWQGASSNNWDYTSANWVPVVGLPFPAAFVKNDDVMFDNTRKAGKDSVSVIGKIEPVNVTFNNTSDSTPYYIYAADTSSKIFGNGGIYIEGTGEVIVGVNTDMVNGLVPRNGIYSADNPNGTINAFGKKVVFEGGAIKINKEAVDNPTYKAPFDIVAEKDMEGKIIVPRRVDFTGKVSGTGTLILSSNGERNIISMPGGANWTEFSGRLNVEKGTDLTSYTPGFYGLVLTSDSAYSLEIDDTLGTGTISEKGVEFSLANTLVNMQSGTTFGVMSSGSKCFALGELSGDEDATIIGYIKRSDSPRVYYRIGSSNTDFTLASRFTGETGSGENYRRYNYMGIIKVGTGTMRLTNPRNYITDIIVVKEGKLFISNPDGSSTGTGFFKASIPLIVGPGAVLGGTGSISRNIDVYGTIEPGEDAVGRLTVSDSIEMTASPERTIFSVNFKPAGGLTAELASGTEYDVLVVDTFVIDGGLLKILPAAIYDLKAGENYKILEGAFANTSAGFDSISLPFADSGWVWNTENLYVDGSISLVSGGGSGTYQPEDTNGTVTINRQFLSQDLMLIYPNPNNGQFILELDVDNATSICIYDAAGSKVFEKEINSKRINVSLENKTVSGIYLVQVKTKQGIISRTIIVRK